MKKALVSLIIVMLVMALCSAVSVYQADGRKIRLVIREVSLGKVHLVIAWEDLWIDFVVSPNSKRVAYMAERRGEWFVVVDGVEGKEYDTFIRGSKLVFDSPNLFHTLAFRGREIFRVEVEIVEE